MTKMTFLDAVLNSLKSSQADDRRPRDSLTLWKPRSELEAELVEKAVWMSKEHLIKGQRLAAKLFVFAEKAARGELEAVHGKYDGFPVFEHKAGKLGKGCWYVYIAWANSKSCVLQVCEGKKRDEAKRRARIWIGRCPNQKAHGEPCLINLNGDVLEPPSPSDDAGEGH